MVCYTRNAFREIRILICFLKYKLDTLPCLGFILTLPQFLPLLCQCSITLNPPTAFIWWKEAILSVYSLWFADPKSGHQLWIRNQSPQICVSVWTQLFNSTLRNSGFHIVTSQKLCIFNVSGTKIPPISSYLLLIHNNCYYYYYYTTTTTTINSKLKQSKDVWLTNQYWFHN